MNKVITILVASISLWTLSCRKESPITPPINPLAIVVEDVTCTEAYLKLSLAASETQRTVSLKRGDSTITTLTLIASDSLFIDEGLSPNKTYTYTLTKNISQAENLSVTAQIATMDTTSQNFTWQIDTLTNSITNSSALYDIKIIDDTLVYAVGDLHTSHTDRFDSTGNWIDPYNAAIWNGRRWELQRIPFTGSCSGVHYPPINSIWAFSFNKLLLTNGGALVNFDGTNATIDCRMNSLISGEMYRIFGNNSIDVYMIGKNGTIVHESGGLWKKEESGTTMALEDIYALNGTVLVSGEDFSTAKGILLRKNGSTWESFAEGDLISTNELFNPKLYGSLASVWIDEKNTIYTGGNLLFKYQLGKWNYVRSLPENFIRGNPNVYYRGFINRIRGGKSNDFWIVGDRNTLRHFNGVTWQQIGLPYSPASEIIWGSIDITNSFCIVSGENGSQAIAIRIKK